MPTVEGPLRIVKRKERFSFGAAVASPLLPDFNASWFIAKMSEALNSSPLLNGTEGNPVNDSAESTPELGSKRDRIDSIYHDAAPGTPEQSGAASPQAGQEAQRRRQQTESPEPIESTSPDPNQSTEKKHHAVTDISGKRMSVEDPANVVVESLHAQISDLTSQVTSLNAKLVKSFGRIGDLEEEIDKTTSNNVSLTKRVETLDNERRQWEERVEGGLLVEKVHVQTELTRMMDRVMEETASRGKAEEDKKKYESELEQLSAQLFSEANLMVAVERRSKLTAEEKSASLEARLRDAEFALSQQAKQMNEIGNMLDQVEKERDDLKTIVATIQSEPADGKLKAPRLDEIAKDSDGKPTAIAKATLPGGEPLRVNLSSVSWAGLQSGPPSPSLFGPSQPFNIHHPLPSLTLDILPFIEFRLFVRHLVRLRASTLATPHETGYPIGHAGVPGGHIGMISPSIGQQARPGMPNPSRHSSFSGTSYQNVLLMPLVNPTVHLAQPFLKRCQEEDMDQTLRLDLAPGLNWLTRRNIVSAILEGHLAIEPLFGSLPQPTCALCGYTIDSGESAEPQANSPVASSSGDSASSRALAMRKLFDKSGSWAASTYRSVSGNTLGSPTPPTVEKARDTRKPNREVYVFHADVPGQPGQRYTLCTHYCLPRLRATCEFWRFLRRVCKGIIIEEAHKKYNPNLPGTPALLTPRRLSDEANPFFAPSSPVSRSASPERLNAANADAKGPSAKSPKAAEGEVEGEGSALDTSESPDKQSAELPSDDNKSSTNDSEHDTQDAGDEASKVGDQEVRTGEDANAAVDDEKKHATADRQAAGQNEKEDAVTQPDDPTKSEESKTSDSTPMSSPPVEPMRPKARSNPFDSKPPVPKRSMQRAGAPRLASFDGVKRDPGAPGSPEKTLRPDFPGRTLLTPTPGSPALHPPLLVRQGSTAGANLSSQQTWEHKTWHEIVKLKEHMFWSRVGAMQQQQS